MLAIVLSLALWPPAGHAAPLSDRADVAAGEWQRVLPPAHTTRFATVYDERRQAWVLAGMGGSATRGEIWTSSSGPADWTRGEATNRIAPGLSIAFSAWDHPADRIVTLLSAQGPAVPLVAWECVRGTGDTWRVIEASGEVPPHRLDPVIAHDPLGRRLFVFGGRGLDNQVIDDGVWMLSLVPSPRWTRLVTEGPAAPPRMLAGVAFDPVRQVLVLYGGEVRTESGGIRTDGEDVWFLDLAVEPPVWHLVAETSPGPGWGLRSTVVSDPVRDRVLTFGGSRQGDGVWEMSMATPGAWRLVGSGAPRSVEAAIGHDRGGDAIVFLDPQRARWRFDLATANWTQADSGSANLPRRLFDAALALDPRDGSVLAMGVREFSSTQAGPVGVAHRLTRYVPGDVGHWEPVVASGDPPPRIAGTAVWDSRRRRWIVLGGLDARTRAPAPAWVLETEPSLAWRPLDAEGIGPIGESLPALYDRARDRLIVLEDDPETRGVWQDANSRLRTWTLTLDGSARWDLAEIAGRAPAGRFGAALALDLRRDRMLVFGGSRRLTGTSLFNRGYDDIWALDLGLSGPWDEILARENSLPQSVDAGADVDAWSDRLELIGGGRSPLSGSQLIDRLGPYERDSVRTLDLVTNTRGPTGTPSGFQGVSSGRTVVDPVAGRAFQFSFAPDAWEWSTRPRHEVRVAIERHGPAGAGGAQRSHGPIELVVHGDDRFDPAAIDVATVRADGVAALASPGGGGGRGGRGDDVDGDGFADRRFLFSAPGGTGTEEAVEFRALTGAGVPVIGLARPAANGRPVRSRVAASLSAPGRPVSVRIANARGPGSPSLLFVEGGEAALLSVQIYDVRGRLLGSRQHRRSSPEATTIELPAEAGMGPGITFVRVQVGDETRVVRSIRLD